MDRLASGRAHSARRRFRLRQAYAQGFADPKASYASNVFQDSKRFLAKEGLLCVALLATLLASCTSSEQVERLNIPPTRNELTRAGPISMLPAVSEKDKKSLNPYVEPGTGVFITKQEPKKETKLQVAGDNNIRLNMVDVEIVDVVDQILGNQLKLDYLIDPDVSGRVTIRTNRELPADNILSILDSVLNMNGAALVEDEGLFRIVPIDKILSAGVTPEVQPVDSLSRTGVGIEIVPIRFIDVDDLVEILQPLLSSDSTVRINAQHNTVLLVGSREELKPLIETIRIFDVDWMKGMSFGLFHLEHANARELVRELEQVFSGFENGAASKVVQFVPIARLNAIVVIASQPEYLARTQTWIERLDSSANSSEEQVFIYSVQNGRASEIANILSGIFEIENAVIANQNRSENRFSVAPGLDPIEFTSPEDSFDPELEQFDSYARANEQHSQKYFDNFSNTTGRKEAKIVADEINNSLIIRTSPSNFKKMEAAIREIDVQPVQVLLEATIAEVTLRDELSYGVQWFFKFGSGNLALSEFSSGSIGQGFPGFSGLFSSNDIRVVFNALDSVSEVRIVSSPQILVLDNQTAQLEVGDEVPIVTQQSQGADGDSDRLVNTIEQRQTGVILNVTPRVNASGLVVLDIQQEVSDVVQTTTSGIDSPTISQRRIGTSVAVGNEQTIALGGLMRDRADEAKQGIPLLSRIPIVGSLFGATNNRVTRTELLVLITPKVIRNHSEAHAVTEELRKRFQSLSPLERKLNGYRYD